MVNKVQIVQLQIKQLLSQMNSKKSYKQCKTELSQIMSEIGRESIKYTFQCLVSLVDLRDLKEKQSINRYQYFQSLVNHHFQDEAFLDYIGELLVLENQRKNHTAK